MIRRELALFTPYYIGLAARSMLSVEEAAGSSCSSTLRLATV